MRLVEMLIDGTEIWKSGFEVAAEAWQVDSPEVRYAADRVDSHVTMSALKEVGKDQHGLPIFKSGYELARESQ